LLPSLFGQERTDHALVEPKRAAAALMKLNDVAEVDDARGIFGFRSRIEALVRADASVARGYDDDVTRRDLASRADLAPTRLVGREPHEDGLASVARRGRFLFSRQTLHVGRLVGLGRSRRE